MTGTDRWLLGGWLLWRALAPGVGEPPYWGYQVRESYDTKEHCEAAATAARYTRNLVVVGSRMATEVFGCLPAVDPETAKEQFK